MIDRRVIGPIPPADAERDDVLDLVRNLAEAFGKIQSSMKKEVGANGCIATGDVEAHSDHRDFLAVGGDPADRHHVPEMAVCHQRGTLRAARHVGELCERLRFVIAEDCGLAHRTTSLLKMHVAPLGRADQPQWTLWTQRKPIGLPSQLSLVSFVSFVVKGPRPGLYRWSVLSGRRFDPNLLQ